MQVRTFAAACAALFGFQFNLVQASENADVTAQLAALQQQIDELRSAQQTPPQSAANAFNPAVSLILSGGFNEASQNPDAFNLPGFALGGESGAPDKGFSLGESELTLSASVDDQWFGQITLAFGEEDGEGEVAVEEAFIQSTALPAGLNLKMGRFLSGIAYLNGRHAHTDTFIDRPYVYRAFIQQSYADDGVQLKYLLPTDSYIEVGAEYLRGDSFPSAGAAHDGRGAYSWFAHTGGDVGAGASWLAGFSQLRGRSVEGEDGFSGDVILNIADFTWKWSPGGNRKMGGIVVRSELFAEKRDGNWLAEDESSSEQWHTRRQGGYAEASYQWSNGWLLGLRTDRLRGDKNAPTPYASDALNKGLSLVTGLKHTEFSQLRAQFSAFDHSTGETEHAIGMQYMVALGAHGAHSF